MRAKYNQAFDVMSQRLLSDVLKAERATAKQLSAIHKPCVNKMRCAVYTLLDKHDIVKT